MLKNRLLVETVVEIQTICCCSDLGRRDRVCMLMKRSVEPSYIAIFEPDGGTANWRKTLDGITNRQCHILL